MDFKYFQPYQSMYVDTRLPEIAQIRKDRYDANAQAYDAMQQKIASIRLEGKDNSLKNALQADIDNLVAGNIGFENMDRTISQANLRIFEDTPLMDALDTAATRRAELEAVDKLTAKGNDVIRFDEDLVLVDPLDPSKGYVQNPDGSFVTKPKIDERFTPTDGKYRMLAEERIDPLQDINGIVGGIASNSIVLQTVQENKNLDAATAAMYLLQGKEVPENKVYELSDNMMREFIATDSGNQMKRELMQKKVNPVTGQLYTEQEAEAELAKLMFDSAAKQIGSEFSYSVNAYTKWALENATPPTEDKDDFIETTYAGETLSAAAGLAYETESGETAEWFVPNFSNSTYTGRDTFGPTGADITNAGARAIDKRLKEKGGFGKFNEEDFENNREDIIRYIFDETDGLGKLQKTEQFKGMNDEQFAKAMIDAIRTTPEKFDLNIESKNRQIIYQDIFPDMLTRGTIKMNNQEFQMNTDAGRDAFLNAIDKTDFSPARPFSFDKNVFESLLMGDIDENGRISYGEDDKVKAKIATSFSVTGEDAGEFRFVITGAEINPDDGSKKLEMTYKLTKDQTKGFELIKEIYSVLDVKDPKAGMTKILDKQASKMIFGTEKEYSYKVEPVHNKRTGKTTFAPVFYVDGKKLSMPDPENPSVTRPVDGMSVMKIIIQRAIKGMKGGKSRLLTATTEDIRPTRSTTSE
jgi:hypothetical protein